MAEWIEREKKGTLNTKLPPSPQYFEAEEGDEVAEVAPSNEVPEQAPQTNAREEEEIASNPSPVEDEPIPITLDEVPSANAKEEEPVADTTDDAPPPSLNLFYFFFTWNVVAFWLRQLRHSSYYFSFLCYSILFFFSFICTSYT